MIIPETERGLFVYEACEDWEEEEGRRRAG